VAKVGDTMQLRRVGDAVSYELCPAEPEGAPCKVYHTETADSSTPKLFAHVGIHNAATEAQLCHLQVIDPSSLLIIIGWFVVIFCVWIGQLMIDG